MMTPEGLIKRKQTMIARHGSQEAYSAWLRQQGAKGGNAKTDKVKLRGFATTPLKVVDKPKKSKKSI